jgi:hypothetical protein
MPRVTSYSSARIFEWFELESRGCDADRSSIPQKTLAVGRYQMRHRPSLPHVPMQPEAPLHGVDHPFAP